MNVTHMFYELFYFMEERRLLVVIDQHSLSLMRGYVRYELKCIWLAVLAVTVKSSDFDLNPRIANAIRGSSL